MNILLSRCCASIALSGAFAFAHAAGPSDVPVVDAHALARTAVASGDNQGRPFAVVDKKNARLHVFGADGRLYESDEPVWDEGRVDRVARVERGRS